MKTYLPLILVVVVLVSGCKESSKIISSNEVETVQPTLQESIPEPLVIDSTFWGRTHMIGTENTSEWIETDFLYREALKELKLMLQGDQELSFKKAVFITENAYFGDQLSEAGFNMEIERLVLLAKLWNSSNPLSGYPHQDSISFSMNRATFQVMTDTIFFGNNEVGNLPYNYDFDDFFGDKDWSKMFVSKLMGTKKGNCHSMPYLYKILAEELGTEAYLSLAPNHVYIKQRSKKAGWYNTELTSKVFPIDAWIMTSGYVSRETILSSIYMDTLSQKQSISLCIADLAQGYKRKQLKDYEPFVLECMELALEYYPNFANGLLLKAETMKDKFENRREKLGAEYPAELFDNPDDKDLFDEMEKTYLKLIKLGYREVPKSTYMQWLSELANNLDKYENKKISNFNK